MVEVKQEPADVSDHCIWCSQHSNSNQQSLLGEENVFDKISSCFSIEIPYNIEGAVCQSCRQRLSKAQRLKLLILESLFKLDRMHIDHPQVKVSEEKSNEEFKFITDTPTDQVVKIEPPQDFIQSFKCGPEIHQNDATTEIGDSKLQIVPIQIKTEPVGVTDDVILEPMQTNDQSVNRNISIPSSLQVNLMKLDSITKRSDDKLTYTATPADMLLLKSKEGECFKSAFNVQSVISNVNNIPVDVLNPIQKFELQVIPIQYQNEHNQQQQRSVLNKTASNNHLLVTQGDLLHSNELNFKCNICSKSFACNRNLNRHINLHNNVKNFKCDICLKTFESNDYLKSHMTCHSDERNFKCSVCCRGFKSNHYLKKHISTHGSERNFKCNVCFKKFKFECSMYKHKKVHGLFPNLECDICSKTFKSNYYLKDHMTTHSEERNYKCNVCLKRFKFKSSFNTHMRVHNNFSNFKCHICFKAFKSDYYLKDHITSHFDERHFICGVCSKSFKTNRCLKYHMTYHSKVPNFECSVCSEMFTSKAKLRVHIMRHSDVRNFKCNICSIELKNKHDLREHMNGHCDLENFECNVSSDTLKNHSQ